MIITRLPFAASELSGRGSLFAFVLTAAGTFTPFAIAQSITSITADAFAKSPSSDPELSKTRSE